MDNIPCIPCDAIGFTDLVGIEQANDCHVDRDDDEYPGKFTPFPTRSG
jgi:hypothetical protein